MSWHHHCCVACQQHRWPVCNSRQGTAEPSHANLGQLPSCRSPSPSDQYKQTVLWLKHVCEQLAQCGYMTVDWPTIFVVVSTISDNHITTHVRTAMTDNSAAVTVWIPDASRTRVFLAERRRTAPDLTSSVPTERHLAPTAHTSTIHERYYVRNVRKQNLRLAKCLPG